MKHSKQHYINLPLAKQHGFTWVYHESNTGLHTFQKPVTHVATLTPEQLADGWQPVPEQLYKVVNCTEEDITDGNLQFFFERGYSR